MGWAAKEAPAPETTMSAADVKTYETLRITTEFGGSNEVSAAYLLESWRDHAEATAVIRAAMAGRSGWFETPSGQVIVRPVA